MYTFIAAIDQYGVTMPVFQFSIDETDGVQAITISAVPMIYGGFGDVYSFVDWTHDTSFIYVAFSGAIEDVSSGDENNTK